MLETVDAPTTSLGHDIDYLHAVREKKRVLEARLKEITEHYDEVEIKLITRMNTEGVKKATGTKGSVSVDYKEFPRITDWEEVCRYVKRNGYFHLFERRVSRASWNELCGKRGKAVPGTEPYVKPVLSLRSLND